MTTEGLAEKPTGTPRLTVSQVLDLCDRILGESGRRKHLFTWLRAPGAQPGDWLAVDAYYPANRLVVLWREEHGRYDQVYTELVPAHGLRLLELAPNEVDGELAAAELALGQILGALDNGPPVREARMSRASEVTPHAAHSTERITLGVLEGLALAAVLFIEGYVGVVGAGLDAGRPVLAFALALDSCARLLGTIAAGRAGEPDWAWGCALGGSPLVASFALLRRGGPVTVEPAPLGGLMAVVALVAFATAVLVGS
jgi:hypothetical protein